MRIVLCIFMLAIIIVRNTAEGDIRTPREVNSNQMQPTKKFNIYHHFHKLCLKAHNKYRAKHGVNNLRSNSTLYMLARRWAGRLARLDDVKNVTHQKGLQIGENIYWRTGNKRLYTNIDYEGKYQLRCGIIGKGPGGRFHGSGGYSEETAHFTQLVWQSTTELGCGYRISMKGTIFVVCNYFPQGNIENQYRANVHRPKNNYFSRAHS
uniref:Putative antigen 5 protein n=1 Tax=Ixodes ricinus TaxID=34613 RepID=A0A0K8R7Y4_IXORI